MSGFGQVAVGLVLLLTGWALPRWVAGSRSFTLATLLDAAPLAFVAAVLFLATSRPIFAGAVSFALGAGFAFADRTVRETLREPVVFTALSELPQVFTHPHLYLPFAGTGLVIGGGIAAVLGSFGLLIAEPAAMTPHPFVALVVTGLVGGLLWCVGYEPWLGSVARALRRLRPSGEPFGDAARLGPVAMLIVHGIIARAERPSRQAWLAPRPTPAQLAKARPVILVQCESFFDARRALPALPRDFLTGFDVACNTGSHGRLVVPAWGANTMRAEFAVLTEVDEAALGYDRFNPYHALARAPIASQVRRLREAGYRTICLHPFDRRFFRRDLGMPALGFDTFLDRETLGGSRVPPYLSDPELADHILRIVDEVGPQVFVFAITMGNHGPWLSQAPAEPELAGLLDPDIPQRMELLRYLGGLRQSDTMLRLLIGGLERRSDDPLLGFYGDHLPSLPRAFAHLGFADWRSDYAIRSKSDEISQLGDLRAHELGRVIVDMVLAPQHHLTLDAVVPEPHHA
jgi:hypothetical protein